MIANPGGEALPAAAGTTSPQPLDPRRQAAADEEQLRVLSVLYYVYGGLTGALSLVALPFLFGGAMMASRGATWWGRPEEQLGATIGGCVLLTVGCVLFLFLAAAAVIRVLTGYALRRHRFYVACLIVAGLSCLEMPLGTALGVATFIVLLRPSTEQLFRGQRSQPAS